MSENSYDHEVKCVLSGGEWMCVAILSFDPHQVVVKWLSLVEQYTLPTAPVELRQAVAVGLGGLWRILVQVCI